MHTVFTSGALAIVGGVSLSILFDSLYKQNTFKLKDSIETIGNGFEEFGKNIFSNVKN